jgi:hypothetical protein
VIGEKGGGGGRPGPGDVDLEFVPDCEFESEWPLWAVGEVSSVSEGIAELREDLVVRRCGGLCVKERNMPVSHRGVDNRDEVR